jgi:hypothetical protein
MTTLARETVLNALFTKLCTAVQLGTATPFFITASRRIKLWGDVPSNQKPALYLIETHDQRTQQPPQGLQSKLLMKASAVIYTFTGSDVDIPSTQLNNAVDALEATLVPDDPYRNVFTLGGLVYRCWVEGMIIKTPGDLDGEGMAIVPINILLP